MLPDNQTQDPLDELLLSPKQIAQLAQKPLATIYRWLQDSEPANPIRKGSRVSYSVRNVKVWLKVQTKEKKQNKGVSSTTYFVGKRVMALREQDNAKYYLILDLLDIEIEPGS
jgi:predicted DNA-binding transcriptional regulator AlpA